MLFVHPSMNLKLLTHESKTMKVVLLLFLLLKQCFALQRQIQSILSTRLHGAKDLMMPSPQTPNPAPEPNHPPKRETSPLYVPTVGVGKDQVIHQVAYMNMCLIASSMMYFLVS